jgi:hypothetical protein
MGDTTQTINVTAIDIASGAFAELLSNVTAGTSLIINISGTVTLQPNAFHQLEHTAITSAEINISPDAIVTLGANAFANLPVQSLVLSASTTLEANALRDLPDLRVLDISAVTTPMMENSLNLVRDNTEPLVILMPTTNLTYEAGSISFPPTNTTSTTTVVFNGGNVPATAFAKPDPATSSAAINVSINPDSNTTQLEANIADIITQLTVVGLNALVPTTVPYSQVQNVIVDINASIAPGQENLISVNQFNGDYFDNCIIAAKVPGAKAIKQCAVIGLTADAIKNDVKNISIPSVIIKNTISHNVINLASRMTLANHTNPFYIIDNYHDPSDPDLANIDVPLVAVFSRTNATDAAFKPALVCNGIISNKNGAITVSGSRGAAGAHCWGHNATQSNTSINLFSVANANTGSTLDLHDAAAAVNAPPIARITFPSNDTFIVQFNPTEVMGCFEEYAPTTANASMVVDFTNVASASGAASNSFSVDVASLIANNNALVALLNQIKNSSIPAITLANPFPATVSISNELTALSKSDFHSVVSAWRILYNKHKVNYAPHLESIKNYVDDVINKTVNSNQSEYVSANNQFKAWQVLLNAAIALVNNKLTGANADASLFYAATVLPYFGTRFSIGMQAFKKCQLLDHVVNFNLLRNISKINDDIFNSCTVLKSPANIPINVSSIGIRAYQNCLEIPSIDIQDAFALRTICESAFESCQQMEGNLAFSSSLGFTESVETIGDKAFRGCTKLTDHLYFPQTLKSIGVSAFDGCIGLNGTIVFPRNASFTVIPERAFAQCSGITGISTNTGNGTSLYYMGSMGSGPIPDGLIIPAQVTSIGKEAFLNCSKLALALNLQQTPNPAQNTPPMLSMTIQEIGNAAFSGCAAFTSLVLPSSVTYTVVAEDCFKGCTGIKELTIPSNVITILDGAFSGCNKIANVPKFDNIISIGNEAFNGCAGMLGPLVLGTNLNILGDRAFFGCKFLTSATFLGPPPLGLSASSLIFGLAAASPTTFHVNVFTENAWDAASMPGNTPVYKINDVFRAIADTASMVNMAFIAFNTYVPWATSRNLTISNFKTFNVYSNTGTAGANVKLDAPGNGFSWNDVYIPGTLKGTDVGNAQSNNNQVATLQSQVASLITPKVDAVQTRTIELLFSAEEALREFDGRNMAIATDLNGAPFQLEVMTAASAAIANNAVYGVFTVNGKDCLYHANDDNLASTLVTSTNNTNVSVFANAANSVTDEGFKTKYANKLISIGYDGEIFVSNVLSIGHNAATAVAHSANVPTTQTGAYTIVKSANPSVKDKLYFKAIIAPAGAYFISKVVGDPDLVYDSTVIYVGQDGSIDVPVRQLKNNFEIIASVADGQGEGYSFVAGQQSGANTAYKFMKGASAAPPGYYLIQLSAVAKFNNAMIHVLPNGGVSTASFGALGSINKLDEYATEIASQSIPLYNDNPVVANFNHYMESILPLNHNNHNDVITDFNAKLASFNSIHDSLNKQILMSAMKTAISTVGDNDTFVNSVGSLDAAVVAASGAINNATAALVTYNNRVDALNADISGHDAKSLKSIQTNTMNKITEFQRSCTFNSDLNATANDLNYITSQINAFVTAILLKQKEQRADPSESAFVGSIITSVKEKVSFVVSPTKVSPAPSNLYAGLSIQQKILFDFTVSFISQWLNNNNNWSVVNAMENPTGLQLLTWATENILSTFVGPVINQSIYQQFLTNNVVPSLANVRTSVSAYDTAFGGANPGTASAAAQLAYQPAVLAKVNDVAANFVAEAAAEAAPTAAVNGKIRFNAALNVATKIFISLNDGAATPVPVSFKEFADTIVLNNVKYTIKSVNTGAVCHTLDVVYVSGTATIANNDAVSFYTYQAVSPYTFVQLDAMNAYVRAQYFPEYQAGNGIAAVSGIKPRIGLLKTALMRSVQDVAAKLSSVASSVADLQLKINTVNAAENKLTAKLQSLSGTGTAALDLAGAQMLARELDLFNAALADQITTSATPSVAELPVYESSWFNQRVSAFWDDSAKADNLKPSVENRTTQYNAVNATFKTARYARQSAAIDLHLASTPPALGMTSPINTQVASEQARAIMQTMPAYITSTKEDLAKLISTKLYNYVKDRDTYVGTDQIDIYKQKKIDEFTKIMSENNYSYGKAAHNRYLSVIDLAISTAFYATVNVGQTNAFQTLMQQWYSASNKSVIFEQNIKSLLFGLVYTTNNTVYSTNDFPLKVATENIAWFGAALSTPVDVKRNGFLYAIIKNGWEFVKDAFNTSSGIPLTEYAVLETLPSVGLAQPLPAPNIQPFSTGLATALVAERAKLTAAIAPVSSLAYSVVGIGYSSLANADATALPVDSLGFTNITGTGQNELHFTITAANNISLYKFTRNGTWYHGYQQSSNLINSWLKLSPTQNAVMFYAGTNDAPATNLYQGSQSSLTALCDDVKYVMIIEAVAGSTTKSVSLYTYDVMGVGSGDLVAVGKLVPGAGVIPVPTIYSVIGAFQKSPSNLININLIGDLIIPSSIKTIGMNAFAKSSQFKSLVFGDDGTSGSVSIGSNAFQDCTALSAINLGRTIGSIGPSAFLNCSKANSLVLPPSNFSVINHWAFLGCNLLGKNGNLVLPASLQQINVQAFARCPLLKCSQFNGLSNSYIPQSLQKIGTGAFLGCTGLAGTLDFNNLNNSGSYASSISFIGSAAFMGCTGLNDTIRLPINSEYKNMLPYVFSSMDAPINAISGQPMVFNPTPSDAPMALIGAIDVSSTKITTIETRAFYKCSTLSSITLSNLVSKIGVQSFLNCSSLGGVLNVPASVLNVGEEAFMGCSTLSGLNIVSATVSSDNAGSGTTLGPKCFKGCTSLVGSTATSGLVIPNNVIRMEDNAFEGCTSIEALTVGSGFTKAGSFGANLFSGCIKLARVVLAFSFLSRDVAGQSVVKNATLPAPQTNPATLYNFSFTGCTALGVVPGLATTGTVQIQSGATGWTAGRAAFFNQLTIVINNKNITFYLKEFNKNISVVDPSKDAVQLEALPVADAQAVVYVKASDMRKVFQVSTDSYVIDQETTSDDNGRLFFVRPDMFPQYLNVANAHVVQGGIESYNSKPYEQLVKDDVMRYYATSLFNSADWVTLFSNDVEMMENMVASSGLMPIVPNGETDASGKNLINEGVLNKIMTELNKIAYTKPDDADPKLVQSRYRPSTSSPFWWALPDTITPEQGNIGMKLFNLISRNDPGRIASVVLNGSTPSELPFLPGDQFIFVFTLNDNEVQLSPELPKVTVKKRTYMIKLALTDDFNSGSSSFADHTVALYSPSPINLNVLPVSGAYAADYMYSNYDLYVAAKPSLLNQTESSVYSRITKNMHEPVPMPPLLLPFTGWYYNYQHSTQSIKLDFTPPDNSVVNYSYSDLRYLSAYIYFPTAWSSQTALPNPNNFPQWVVTFVSLTNNPIILYYKATFLNTQGADTVNFLGQTVPFDYTNTHVQLICPFDNMPTELSALLAGKLADGTTPGTLAVIAGTDIYRQRHATDTVSGLRKPTSNMGPFTYPPIARGYQGINMKTQATAQDLTVIKALNSGYRLGSIALDINMTNNDGFVPSVIVKSVEVVAKKYEAYYLAPLDPN